MLYVVPGGKRQWVDKEPMGMFVSFYNTFGIKPHFSIFTILLLCICVHVHVWIPGVCATACVEVKGQPSTVFAIEYAVLAGLHAPEILLPPILLQNTSVCTRDACYHAWLFMGSGIHHQALMLKLQARYAELSHQLINVSEFYVKLFTHFTSSKITYGPKPGLRPILQHATGYILEMFPFSPKLVLTTVTHYV